MVSVSGITGGFKTIYQYGKRALKVAPELAFGTSSEAMAKAMKAQSGSVFQKAEAGWKALEGASKGNFFKSFWANCKNFIPDIKTAYKAASGAGAKGVWSGVKGVFKSFGKKMPFIMSAMMILTEAPNVFKAVKEKGLVQGAKEVLKFGARMTTAGLGSAIGTAFGGFLGGIVGWSVGEWLASKVVGKSYTEQVAEKEKMMNELLQPQQVQMPQTTGSQTINPYWLNPASGQVAFSGATSPYDVYQMQNAPYSDDIMMKQMHFNTLA